MRARAYTCTEVGQVLFYRAPLEATPAEILSISLSPVRPLPPGLPARLRSGQSGGRVRVILRYAVGPEGAVFTHRGWLYTAHPPGRRLRVLGHQYDGAAVLLSLGLVPVQAGGERARLGFELPFALQSWGVTAATGVDVSLSCSCAAEPGALLLRGRAHLRLETPGIELMRTVHFCRYLAADLNPHLDWRAYARVEGLDCRIGPDGAIEGRLQVAASCRGTAPAPPKLGGAGACGVAVVRQVTARVVRSTAEYVSDGQALVSGAVEVDVAWADRSGKGRWTCLERPFSAMLAIPGLAEGDRLEPVAQLERLSRLGSGEEEKAFLLLAVGLTALRPAHLPLDGGWYRVERVVGQAVGSLDLALPLFPREGVRATARSGGPVRCESGVERAWSVLHARLRVDRTGRPPALEVRGEAADGGFRHRAVVGAGSLAGEEIAPGLAAVRPGMALVRPQALPVEGGVEVAVGRGDAVTAAWLDVPAPAWAVLGVELLRARGAWALRCLVRCGTGLRLAWRWMEPPEAGAEPVAATVSGTAIRGVGMEALRAEVEWRAK